MADVSDIKIPSLKEDEYFEKRGKKHDCYLWSQSVPYQEVYMKEGDYLAMGHSKGQTSNIHLVTVAACPGTTEEGLRAGIISMVITKLKNELEAANELLEQLKKDGKINQNHQPIIDIEFTDEYLFKENSKRYKRYNELKEKYGEDVLIAI